MSNRENKAIFEMTPEELIGLFGNSAASWACHGVGMLRSAYVVWEVFWERAKRSYQHAKDGQKVTPADMLDMYTDRFVHTYTLLAASAIENMAKGLVIAQGKLEMENHKLPSWFATHDILSLLQKVSFKVNKQERSALTDCTKAIAWQTRYPMPKAAKHLPTKWPGMEFAQRFNHPTNFRDLATRMLHDYPNQAFQPGLPSASDLIHILELECPDTESLGS